MNTDHPELPHTTAATRIFCSLGSVHVKMLIENRAPFTVFAFNADKGRLMARNAQLHKCGSGPAIRITTPAGSFEFGVSQRVAMPDGSWAPASGLAVGSVVRGIKLINSDGLIYAVHPTGLYSLMDLVELDFEGIAPNAHHPECAADFESLTISKVETLPDVPICWVQVDSAQMGTTHPQKGHNFLIWPDGTSFGRGLLIG